MSALRRIELSPASVPLLFPDGHTDVQETEYNSILDEFSQAQADDRTRVEREGWDYCYKCRRDNVAGVSFTTIDTETESMALRKNPGSQVITRVQSNGKLKNLAGFVDFAANLLQLRAPNPTSPRPLLTAPFRHSIHDIPRGSRGLPLRPVPLPHLHFYQWHHHNEQFVLDPDQPQHLPTSHVPVQYGNPSHSLRAADEPRRDQ